MARVARRKGTPAAAGPDEKPRPAVPAWFSGLFTGEKLTGGAEALKGFFLNLAIIVLVIVLVPVIGSQFWRNDVLIEPIAVPEQLVVRGLTAEVVANRIWDGLIEVKRLAQTSKSSIAVVPDSLQVDFSIPDSGLSIDSLIHHVRRFFGAFETRITGEITCADETCAPEDLTLRLRVSRQTSDVIYLPPLGAVSEELYFREAASEVMAVLDPFTAISYAAETEPLRATVLARRLIRGGHPDSEWAYNLVGNMLIDAGDVPGAIVEYREALALDANFTNALVNLGNALRIEGDLIASREAFERAFRIEPGNVFALSGFADLALLAGQPDQAIGYLVEAAERDPLTPDWLAKAGTIELNRGNTEAAFGHFARALEIDPAYPLALAQMAASYLNAENYREAERLFRNAAGYAPNDAAIAGQHADLLYLAGDFAEAEAAAARAIRLAPENAGLHKTRGDALAILGRREEAEADYATAETLHPDGSSIVMARANNLMALGDNEGAIAAFRRYRQMVPSDDIMLPLVDIYLGMLAPATEPTDQAAGGDMVTE